MNRRSPFFFVLVLLSGAVLAHFIPTVYAQDATSTIQAQIDAHNQQIATLDAQIAAYQKQLDTLGTQHQTLQSAIQTIDVSRQQTGTQLQVTQNKIEASNLQLQELSGQITQKEYQIELDKKSLEQSIRDIDSADDASIVEQVLAADSLAEAWTNVDANAVISDALRTNADALSGVTQQLAGQQTTVSQTKDQLSSLGSQLSTQQQQLDAAKAAKAKLLADTKNKESTYQTLIATKKAQEKAFETELSSLQSQLKSVSQSSIPTIGVSVLAWPFSAAVMQTCVGKAGALGNPDCITQYFGNTPFATANPSIYNGMGHDGVDIGVPIGTPVQAALAGTVLGTGNTDLAHDSAGNQCYSFGKWVMLKHANGLATLYGHLSQINVTKGQAVTTGQVIGLSGMTGYATGPHLHFGVYASAGVQIMDLGAWRVANGGAKGGTPCTAGGAVLPVAPNNAYLNPMSYLP